MFYDRAGRNKSRISKWKGGIHMNLGILIIAIVGGAAGILSTLFLTVSFPAVIIWKIYRRIRYSIPITK